MTSKWTLGWIAVGGLPLVFLAVFFVYPLVTILVTGLGWSDGGSPWAVLTSESLLDVLWFTTWQAVVSTVATVVIALPMAHALAREQFRGKTVVKALVTVPFVLPTVVVASAFTALSARLSLDEGTLRIDGTVWAILLAHIFFNYAVVVRTVASYWTQLDPRAEEAAQLLGASRIQVFRHVTFPRLRPAIGGSAAIVFLFSFTSFGIVLILGGPERATLDTEIWRYATQRTEFDVASTIALLQLVVVISVLVLNGLLLQRVTATERPRPGGVVPSRPVAPRWTLWATLASAAVLVGLPVLMLVERSLRAGGHYSLENYRALFRSGGRFPALPEPAANAILNSLWFALIATIVATSIGLAAALVSVRATGWRRIGYDTAFLLPLGTSGVLLGLGFLIALDEPPLDLRSSWILVPLAHALVGLPFVLRAVSPVLRSIDRQLRDAAALLGATPGRVWREIDLPVGARAAAVGAGFAFAVSLGEFGATAFVSRPDSLTVPVAIFRLLGRPGASSEGQAMALAVILMALAATAVLVIERFRSEVASEF